MVARLTGRRVRSGNAERQKAMQKIEIAKLVATKVEEILGKETEAIESVKNNGVKYTGVTIKTDKEVSSIIYIDEFIERNLSVDEIAEKVAQSTKTHQTPEEVKTIANKIRDWAFAKTKIEKRLVSSSQDFKDIVNVKVPGTDLSFIYCISMNESVLGSASIKVTNRLMDEWDIDLEELEEVATVGEVVVQPMKEVLMEYGSMEMEDLEEAFEEEPGMLVVSNKTRTFGAGCVLEALDQIQEKVKGREFYILPSSVHEVLVVYGTDLDVKTLKEMVEMVNETEVSPEDILSYNIYKLTEEGLSIVE